MKSGYLVLYADGGDEIHANLVTKEHYDNIVAALDISADAADEAYAAEEPIHRWRTQTMCHEEWPYKDTEILGTVHIWML